jgi:protein TonB
VVSARKKAMENKPPPPKKKAAPAPPPAPVKERATVAAAPVHVAPIETDVKMGNVPDDDGPGLPVLPPKAREIAAATPEPPKLLARVRRREAVAEGASDDCTEEPSKPVVLARPTDIEYTQKARTDGIQGRLVLQVTVGADGSVSDVKVVKSVEAGLDAAAVAAVQTWRFRPAMRCGKPTGGGLYTIAQRFELGD